VTDPVLGDARGAAWADETILLVEDDHGDAVIVQACLAEVGVEESSV
jgi:hypothetical protein